jgi:hypothetical protein
MGTLEIIIVVLAIGTAGLVVRLTRTESVAIRPLRYWLTM